MSGQVVLTNRSERVGYLTLNRPEALNAITVELGRALYDALVAFAEDVDVIVIRGAGGNFCAGGDFDELGRLRAKGRDAMAALFDHFGRACAMIADLPATVVTVVEGYAMAGGFELMQAADIALVRADARLADNHSNFGQVPGGGGTQRLARLVGRQRALGHILTGERLSGVEAATWGLAYRAFEPEDFEAGVERVVARLAGHDGAALARSKRLVYAGLEGSLSDGLALEREGVLDHLTGDHAGAGIAAFHDKRTRA